jgi:prepilin-type N-terminal cleavage/methylation domain-containing protein
MSRRRGFTIVEMLVVVGIVVLLMGILLPALGKVREQARRTACMSNLRTLTQAWLAYAADHDRDLPTNTTNGDWVMPGPGLDAVTSGKLYRYVNDYRVYRCPQDEGERYRSYSINDYLNGDSLAIPHAHRLSEVSNGAATFAFIEERDPRTYNIGGFVVLPYPRTVFMDHPAVFHGRGSALSFVDAHCEFWTWTDARTWTFNLNYDPVQAPGSPDLRQLQGALGLGPVPQP